LTSGQTAGATISNSNPFLPLLPQFSKKHPFFTFFYDFSPSE
jgi:hypothetical protein